MGNSRDREFMRWGVHEMGSSGDGEFTRRGVQEMESSRDGTFPRWGVGDMRSSVYGFTIVFNLTFCVPRRKLRVQILSCRCIRHVHDTALQDKSGTL